MLSSDVINMVLIIWFFFGDGVEYKWVVECWIVGGNGGIFFVSVFGYEI